MVDRSVNQSGKFKIEKLGEIFVQWDKEDAQRLYSQPHFFGKPLGARKIPPSGSALPYTYSYFEVCYLLSKDMVEVFEDGEQIDLDRIMEFAKEKYENFSDNYLVYSYFRDKNYVVRPGMKFGSEFIAYTTGPGIDHAEYVVHVLHDHSKVRAFDLVKAGRLAGTVKKIFLLAYITEDQRVEFLNLDRVKI